MIAIGDSENDIEMVNYAGIGIAVENASDVLKDNADFVTKSNNGNDVSFVIEKFIF